MPVIPCPHLGLDDDETVSRTAASPAHRCYARRPPAVVDAETQKTLCLSGHYAACQYCPEATIAKAAQPSVAWQEPSGQPLPPSDLPAPKWAVSNESQPAVTLKSTGLQPVTGSRSSVLDPAQTAPAWGGAHQNAGGETVSAAVDVAEDKPSTRRYGWLWLLLPVAAIVAFGALFAVVGSEWLRPSAANSSATQAVAIPPATPPAIPPAAPPASDTALRRQSTGTTRYGRNSGWYRISALGSGVADSDAVG